ACRAIASARRRHPSIGASSRALPRWQIDADRMRGRRLEQRACMRERAPARSPGLVSFLRTPVGYGEDVDVEDDEDVDVRVSSDDDGVEGRVVPDDFCVGLLVSSLTRTIRAQWASTPSASAPATLMLWVPRLA